MQNQKTQKSLVAKVLVLFAVVTLMFAGVNAFADEQLDLSTLSYGDGYDKLELTATDANIAEKVVNQWKAQNSKLDAKVTKDSIKVDVAGNVVTVTPATGDAGKALKGSKALNLVGSFNLSQMTVATDKKLVLAPKDGKVDATAGLEALKAAGVKVPATVTKDNVTFTVGTGDKATKVTVKAVDGQTAVVTGEKELDFTVDTTKPWYKEWLVILLIVVGVTAASGGVFFFVKKNKKNK